MHELDRFALEEINKKFNEIKKNKSFDQFQKNRKYADLMTNLENIFDIPLLACDITEDIDQDVYHLYTEISNARDMSIYDGLEEK